MKPFSGNYGKTFDFKGLGMKPFSIAISGCLYGQLCNYKGEENPFESVAGLREGLGEAVTWVSFCPEEVVMGTPREPMNLVGGTGIDVLEGRARVLTHSGTDITEKMVEGAERLLQVCQANDVKLAILMEGSPACGSHWVFDGAVWPEKKLVEGSGVASALLQKNGIQVMSPLDIEAIDSLKNWIEKTSIAGY